jgi:hypothetical protein
MPTGLESVKIAGRSATKLFIWSHRHFSDDVTLELDPSMYLRHCKLFKFVMFGNFLQGNI